MKHPKITEMIEKLPAWKDEIKLLREIATQLDVSEEIKWKQPTYVVNGENVFILSVFKTFCTVHFFNGVLLKDEEKVLTSHGDYQQASRIIKFKSLEEVQRLEPIVRSYMIEAIENAKQGIKPEKEKIIKVVPYPSELLEVFEEMPRFKEAFDNLTPGRRKAYLLYYNDGKQRQTRINRIHKYIDKILDGKGMAE